MPRNCAILHWKEEWDHLCIKTVIEALKECTLFPDSVHNNTMFMSNTYIDKNDSTLPVP